MIEIFKSIPGYSPYEISNLGRLKRYEKILSTPISSIGYKRKYLKDLCKNLLIHRAIAICFIENPENLSEVNHIDGNKSNNSIDNLEWVSRQGNASHAKKMGLLKTHKGQDSIKAKLSNDYIPIIRDAISAGFSQRKIAAYFGVSQTAISLINRGINWKSI